jgi:hypothetical protein
MPRLDCSPTEKKPSAVDFFGGQLLTFSVIVIFYTTQSVDFFNRQSLTFLFAKNSRYPYFPQP